MNATTTTPTATLTIESRDLSALAKYRLERSYARALNLISDEPKLHLKDDLGIDKRTLKESVLDGCDGLPAWERKERGFDTVVALLTRRTQQYTIDECQMLMDYYLTAHDECVCDYGTDEFHALQVHAAEKKKATYDKARYELDVIEECMAEHRNKIDQFIAHMQYYVGPSFVIGYSGSHIWVHEKYRGHRLAIIIPNF